VSELVNSMTLAEIAELVGGTLEGDPDLVIEGVESLSRARKKHLAFFNKKNANVTQIENCKAGCLLADPGVEKPAKTLAIIYIAHPSDAFTQVYQRFLPAPPQPAPGVHPTAVIAESASVGEGAYIGPYAVISDDVTIGPGAVIHPHVVIMQGVSIGKNFRAYPGVVVREFCQLGDDVLLQAGAVIGTEGFGYTLREGELRMVPQLGIVKLEDDVHVGANCTIDRARFGQTRIGRGTKIDNLSQIGHNVSVGVACGIAAQTGIAGSVEVGDFCNLGGQTGIAHSVKIGAGSNLLARAGAITDVAAGTEVYDMPALTKREFFGRQISMQRLPEMMKLVRSLNQRVSALENSGAS